MQFSILSSEKNASCDLIVMGVFEKSVESSLQKLGRSLDGLQKILKKEGFEGKAGQAKLIHGFGKISAHALFIVGLGDEKKFDLEALRRLAAKISKQAQATQSETVVWHLPVSKKFIASDAVQTAAEGLVLGGYEFTRYKKGSVKPFPKKVTLIATGSGLDAAAKRGQALARGIMKARDLINTPAADMKPLDLAKSAQNLPGVQTKIYTKAQIQKWKMGAYLGVSQGSVHPPAFIEMHYKPKGKAKKKIVLVGKGVTFDSGGLSLKPPKSMETMKDDMSGAAAVIGLMSVISELSPSVEVWGLVAATENMPDAMAQRPGDIVRAMNGKTIEVLNTDAEGRLTLADAVHYATLKKPDYIVDAATLTGACLVALGDRYSAIYGNDEELVKLLIDAGEAMGEKHWELPLAEEYRDELKSPIADLKNIGGSYGGSINGALFIQEFVGNSKWAHLDIAGPSWTEKPREYETRGGTGVMVRTWAKFLDGF